MMLDEQRWRQGNEQNLRFQNSHVDWYLPSLIPHARVPVKVNFSVTRSKSVSSISFKTDKALEANWMGPPNRWKASVFSYTVTSKPFLSVQRAQVRPPTPPPAMATLRGLPGRDGRPRLSHSLEAAAANPSLSDMWSADCTDLEAALVDGTTLGCRLNANALGATPRRARKLELTLMFFDVGCVSSSDFWLIDDRWRTSLARVPLGSQTSTEFKNALASDWDFEIPSSPECWVESSITYGGEVSR